MALQTRTEYWIIIENKPMQHLYLNITHLKIQQQQQQQGVLLLLLIIVMVCLAPKVDLGLHAKKVFSGLQDYDLEAKQGLVH